MLLLATRNAHKTREIRTMLAGVLEVTDLLAHPDLPEIEETGTSFEANAILKAVGISKFWDGLVLADDSGLEVDALGGDPGVRSARFAGTHATDEDNNALLLERLAALPSTEPRTGRFRCVLALAQSGTVLATFDGSVEGTIINELQGSQGFGYDPLFIPNGYDSSFGVLPAETKSSISHRSRALAAFRSWLEDNVPSSP